MQRSRTLRVIQCESCIKGERGGLSLLHYCCERNGERLLEKFAIDFSQTDSNVTQHSRVGSRRAQ